MDPRLAEYLEKKEEEKRAEDAKLRQEQLETRNYRLIDAGLYDQELCDAESSNYSEWDPSIGDFKYYKRIPITVTDEEYAAFLAASKEDFGGAQNKKLAVVVALQIIGWGAIAVGLILGFVLGANNPLSELFGGKNSDFSFATAFTYWLTSAVCGILLLGFAKVIELLNDIKTNVSDKKN